MSELSENWRDLDKGAEESKSLSELTQQINEFDSAAYKYYLLEQLDSALKIYTQAYSLSKRLGDRSLMAKYKEWQGHCMSRLGRLNEALVYNLELEEFEDYPVQKFLGLVNQLRIASLIPIPLDKILRLVRRCHDTADDFGLQKSKSMIYSVEYNICGYRHDFQEGLAKAQEALASYYEEGTSYDIEVYYRHMVNAYLHVDDRENAEHWLKKYEELNTRFEISKELSILNIKRLLAVLDGNLNKAYRLAEEGLMKAREGDKNPYSNLIAFATTALKCGKLSTARHTVAELVINYRNSECGHYRYEVRRLTGDYHRAMAKSGDRSVFHREIARKQYNSAMEVGNMIDSRLQCDWHEKEITERLQSLM